MDRDEDDGGFLHFAGIRFASTALLAPLENAKILQQVNYIPSDDFLAAKGLLGRSSERFGEGGSSGEGDRAGEHEDGGSDSEDGDDDSLSSSDASGEMNDSAILGDTSPLTMDPMGYLLRTSFDEEDPTRPQYQLKPQDRSLLSTAGQVLGMENEGFLSLWKGQFANWTHEMMSVLMQPTLEGVFNDLFQLPDDSIPLVHLDSVGPNFATLMVSHIATGVILSPIELIRTRLAVQSAAPRHRKYGGLINGLSKFSAEEGYSTAFAAPILSASILYHGLVCFFKNSPPLIINRILGISGQDAPVLYALCELVINITELIVLLPVETARRRLFCQPRPRILVDDRPFRPLVELRPLPYTGVIDCMKSVIAEEGGLRHRTRRGGRRRPSTDAVGGSRPWWDGFGLKGLYRGVKEHFWATVGLLVVSALQVIDDEEF